METPVEYSNTNAAGRVIETPEGKRLVTDLRMLGCPDEIATRVEKRNAELKGEVPAGDLKSQFETFKATILSAS